MARSFLTNISMNQNQITGLRLENASSVPGTAGATGQIIFVNNGSTITDTYVYTGAAWTKLTRSGTITNSDLSGTAGITNANLANSAVTIGTTSISLGASSTTLAGMTTINAHTVPTGTASTYLLASNIGGSVQAWDADLDAIAALAGTSGFLKKTAANTWSLDTNTYLTSSTGVTTFSGGTTGLTPSSATSGAITLAGTLAVANGGTGVTTSTGTGSVVLSASPTFTGNVTVPTPTNGTDAANKAYVDAAVVGIDWKPSVRVATTTAGTLASSFANGSSVDGVTLATGDRILIKDQATGSENGIYTVNASGAPTRATDADTSAEVTSGLAVFVEEGTTNADSGWVLTTNSPITLGTTALVFTQFTGLGQITAGAGLTKTGNTIDVVTADAARITVNANSIDISATYVGQTSITTLGTIASGTWNASTITVPYGGTGATTLTSNGVLLGNGTSAISATTAGTADQVLRIPGAGGAPAFGAIDLTKSAAVTGALTVTNGGTGAASFSNNNSLLLTGASGTAALTSIANGTSGYVLTSNGAGVAPTWQASQSSKYTATNPTATGTYYYLSSGVVYWIIQQSTHGLSATNQALNVSLYAINSDGSGNTKTGANTLVDVDSIVVNQTLSTTNAVANGVALASGDIVLNWNAAALPTTASTYRVVITG